MDLVSKLWGFCNKLRHDGVDPADYIEQLTYLLFLKMAEEKAISVPHGYNWNSLIIRDNDSVLAHLDAILNTLKNEKGILGDIFSEPVSRVRNSHILKSLIKEIDTIHWTAYDADVVGLAFEELIGKVANEGKKGAGQYFTPRPLIQAIVEVMKPNPFEHKNFRISDVAVGTAGFLVVASEWFKKNIGLKGLKKNELDHLRNNTYYGQELVQRPRRLALMNMFLHNINAKIKLGDTIYGAPDENAYSCILSNPPFGTKGANQIPDRDFPVKTSDKQLNFIQHIIEKLEKGGRAAIVLPDSCLSSEASKKIWSYYLDKKKSNKDVCSVHTIIKLPEGIFAAYANGVKACVVFLEKGKELDTMWMYDGRKNVQKITTKSNSLKLEHFEDFMLRYGKDPNGTSLREETDRFVSHTLGEIREKDFDLSFSEVFRPVPLQHPTDIIDQMIADYQAKIETLIKLKNKLPKENEHT